MNIPIAILSKSRADELHTINLLKSPLNTKPFYIFIEPSELDQYEQHKSTNTTIVPFATESTSYCDAINKVFEYFKSNKTQHFWLADDDVQYFYTRTTFNDEKKYWHLKDASSDDICDAFKEAELELLKHDYSQLSFSYRQTNAYFPDDYQNNRACSVLVLMNTKYVDGHAPWCKVWGDIELSLRMIYNRHPNCICYKYAFGYPGMSKNAGGLLNYYESEEAIQETKDIVDKAISIYGPNIIKPVYKKAHGSRLTELQVSWKKIERMSRTNNLW